MDWLGWGYLGFGVMCLLLAQFGDWRTPRHARVERLCDRNRKHRWHEGEALFIREAGDKYVAGCFGPALPI
jgi:hypothetical protein